MTKPLLAGKGKNTKYVNDMKKTKKYVTPEIQLMKIDMAPLLAGSGENTYGAEDGNRTGDL